MATPPSTHWHQPLTTAEVRRRAGSWNLAADASLLASLQQFSESVAERAGAVSADLSRLLEDSVLTAARLETAGSQLLLISNSRFVESRVQEEEVSAHTSPPPRQKQAAVSEEGKQAVHDRHCRALALGGHLLDTAYERLEVSDSDSDDPLSDSAPVEPRDRYLHRLLPYVISSRQFADDDAVGLQLGPSSQLPASPTDEEISDQDSDDFPGQEQSPRHSDATRRDEEHSRESSPFLYPPPGQQTIQTSSTRPADRRAAPSTGISRYTRPSAGDLFGPDSDLDLESDEQLGDNQLFGGVSRPAVSDLWGAAAAPLPKPDLWGSADAHRKERPPEDDRGSVRSGASGTSGREQPQPPPPSAHPAKRLPVGAVSMFGGLDVFGARRVPTASSGEEEPPSPATQNTVRRRSRPINTERSLLLSDDDEEDLFHPRGVSGPLAAPPPQKPRPQPSRPADARARPSTAPAVATGSLFSSSDEERGSSAAPTARVPPARRPPVPAKGLFDSDSDDDIFAIVAPVKRPATAAPSNSAQASGDASVPEARDAAGVTSSALKRPVLSSDESDTVDVGEVEPRPVKPAPRVTADPPSPGSAEGGANAFRDSATPRGAEVNRPAARTRVGLFSSSEDDDLFTPQPPAVPSKAQQSTRPPVLVESRSGSTDCNTTDTPPTVKNPDSKQPGETRTAAPVAAAKKAPSASLFDSDSDEDDLFHPSVSGGLATVARSTSSRSTLVPSGPNTAAEAGPINPAAPQSNAISPEIIQSHPMRHAAPQPGPANPASPQPGAVSPAAPQPGLSPAPPQPSPANPAPPQPGPANPAPHHPSPAIPAPPQPGPIISAPSQPGSANPAAPQPGSISPASPQHSPTSPLIPQPGPVSAAASHSGPPNAVARRSGGLSELASSIEQQLGAATIRRRQRPAGGVALPGVATTAEGDTAQNRLHARPDRPVSMPVMSAAASDPPPDDEFATPADAPATLSCLTKSRARGPVRRRPSQRRATAANRLSLPTVDPSTAAPPLSSLPATQRTPVTAVVPEKPLDVSPTGRSFPVVPETPEVAIPVGHQPPPAGEMIQDSSGDGAVTCSPGASDLNPFVRQVRPQAADSPATVQPVSADAAASSRRSAAPLSLFDSDSDEDLFHVAASPRRAGDSDAAATQPAAQPQQVTATVQRPEVIPETLPSNTGASLSEKGPTAPPQELAGHPDGGGRENVLSSALTASPPDTRPLGGVGTPSLDQTHTVAGGNGTRTSPLLFRKPTTAPAVEREVTLSADVVVRLPQGVAVKVEEPPAAVERVVSSDVDMVVKVPQAVDKLVPPDAHMKTEQPLVAEVEGEASPDAHVKIEAPPAIEKVMSLGADIETEVPPAIEVEREAPPSTDMKIEATPAAVASYGTRPDRGLFDSSDEEDLFHPSVTSADGHRRLPTPHWTGSDGQLASAGPPPTGAGGADVPHTCQSHLSEKAQGLGVKGDSPKVPPQNQDEPQNSTRHDNVLADGEIGDMESNIIKNYDSDNSREVIDDRCIENPVKNTVVPGAASSKETTWRTANDAVRSSTVKSNRSLPSSLFDSDSDEDLFHTSSVSDVIPKKGVSPGREEGAVYAERHLESTGFGQENVGTVGNESTNNSQTDDSKASVGTSVDAVEGNTGSFQPGGPAAVPDISSSGSSTPVSGHVSVTAAQQQADPGSGGDGYHDSLFQSPKEHSLPKTSEESIPTPVTASSSHGSSDAPPLRTSTAEFTPSEEDMLSVGAGRGFTSPNTIRTVHGEETFKKVGSLAAARVQKKPLPSRSLFSSDSDEEDLFGAARTAQPRPVQKRTTASARAAPGTAAATKVHLPRATTVAEELPRATAAAAGTAVTSAQSRKLSEPQPDGNTALSGPVSCTDRVVTAVPSDPARSSAAVTVRSGAAAVSARHASDDEEDLFQNSRNAPSETPRSEADWEQAAVKAKATAKPHFKQQSLFSDDDDEDDLFGGKSIRSQAGGCGASRRTEAVNRRSVPGNLAGRKTSRGSAHLSSPRVKSTAAGSSDKLFSDSEEDSDIFGREASLLIGGDSGPRSSGVRGLAKSAQRPAVDDPLSGLLD